MSRRFFLLLGATVSTGYAFFGFFGLKKENQWDILQSIQNHLFPKNGNFPNAQMVGSVRYLKLISKDPSFDKDDLDFIFRGVEEIQNRGWKSVLSDDEKEQIISKFSKTVFGENWLSMVLNYTFEALLSDPIYGGNIHEQGWKSLDHHAGVPRPTVRFGSIV